MERLNGIRIDIYSEWELCCSIPLTPIKGAKAPVADARVDSDEGEDEGLSMEGYNGVAYCRY